MISKQKVECSQCNCIFEKLETEINRYAERRNFCSRECYFLSRKAPNQKCTHCQKEYEVRNRKTYKNNFCSKNCSLNHTISRNDFTGQKMGRCVVQKIDKENTHRDKYWLVKCACKEVFSVRHSDIRRGKIYECPNCVFRRSQYYIGGKKFGRLSVLDKWEWRTSPENGKRFRYWSCICECGNELWILGHSILRAHTVSCGCYMQKNCSRYVNETLYPIKHGYSGKKRDNTYCRWTVLMSKCHNPKYLTYNKWGALGYFVCEKWRNDYGAFRDWMYSQGFNDKMGIEIKEGKKEFSPANCYLDTVYNHNKKMRDKLFREKYGIQYKGETHTLREWSEILGIGFYTLKSRWAKCKDMKECAERDWKDGSGCHLKRDDISDEQIKKLYEEGMTVQEIGDIIGSRAIMHRLQKMGVKIRP